MHLSAVRALQRRASAARPTLPTAAFATAPSRVRLAAGRPTTAPRTRAYHLATAPSTRPRQRATTNGSFPVAQRGYASRSYPSHTLINMPALSPTMTSGNLGQWNKKVGDEIQPGDVLVEVETDKATMDFENQDEGFIAKIFVESGTKDVAVNKPIAILVENKEDVEKFADYKLEDNAAPASAPAAEEKPVEKAPEEKPEKKEEPQKEEPKKEDAKQAAPKSGASQKPAPKPAPAPAPAPGAAYTDIPLSNVRKVIAGRLAESKQQIPHYYLTQEINADKIYKLREVLNSEAKGKFKLSVNDFVIRASALALKAVPEVNSAWQGTSIRQFNNADIAVAVATESGLITPIVHQADAIGLSQISTNVKTLAEKARANKLQPHEYQGGTFTISNLGMYGISHFTAIINPPHSGILAVGGVQDKLVIDDAAEKGVRNSKVMNVTLSCDHRVVDGAVGAKWLGVFKGLLENPLTMLL
ncbi:pyruvate dehydrogenase complex dihydrolipoamide acetyltransferase [Fimicolochytrium jonesii]|uniref:pyruvate dehydrogenase complex dihydrolipoamide acetyltransferase n=1 Tax=Fimicolochytrium jonesii TaxID=1396493 RepID=UPI0022FEE7DC|nr:pyruvate dehydrogenase complex dihydrolipoamide acetyltransferase [Fimicolochytrium jonesii]KAI8823690.1 pyruvate dehydrogenase complex dihydrolipoamide acetyltransferase [Fimicolochytrium jonesii]